ncbi:alpha/beta hydrolase [Paenibacillus xanthanilyticus]|uniref:Alpha/beta hydrolase n=1 Tax=Paenibacillus xanthanilyticus TaxID=1783531 RepID=A0ABV8K6U2_9BACL
MALMQCDFFSETLGVSASMNVILPQRTTTQIGMASAGSSEARHPVLYLLHGLSDDHTIWLRRTSIERYVAPLGIAVVMPAVGRSFYANMKQGYKYWDFISEELPSLARSFFPISGKREDNFVAGLSMGGYGAFKLALSHPDRFAAAASLSGALDARFFIEQNKEEAARIFGGMDDFIGSDNDLLDLAKRRAAEGCERLPLLYQCCGTEDFLFENNVDYRDAAMRLGLPLTYEEGPGEHEWGYWDAQIQRVLEWLPLTKNET